MFKSTITKEELNEMPVKAFEGKIILVDTMEKLSEAVAVLETQTLLGFDTESRPSFQKGQTNRVALLQLSTATHAFLFRLNRIGLPDSLARILGNKNIIKVGVAIRDDIKHLQRLHHFKPEFYIELQEFVKQFKIENFSLAKIAAIVLNFKVSKRQQLSNWESQELTHAQQLYAATDAWVSYEIYQHLNLKKL